MKPKKGEIIHITWVDSTGTVETWSSEIDFDYDDNDKGMIMESIGYFLRKTKLSTTICQSRRVHEKSGGAIVSKIFSIPNVSITQITILK